MTPRILERAITMTESMKNAMRLVLKGMFHRYESLSDLNHPGWDESGRHRDNIDRIRGRIIDQDALNWPEDQTPDTVCVTHNHTIYRIDYTQGTLKAIGTMPRFLPDETEIMQVFEVA